MERVRLAVVVPFHRRIYVSARMMNALNGVRWICHYEGVVAHLVGLTDDAMTAWHLGRNGFSPVLIENDPLTRKLTVGREHVRDAMPDDIDGILGLGSDDFIDANYIRAAADACRRGVDFWGVRDGYFYDEPTGRMIHWPGYTGAREGEPIGPGRMLSRRYHELCGWKPWGDTPDRYTDRAMMRVLDGLRDQVTVETTSLAAIDATLCDVKTSENLTPFSAMLASPGVREANQGERERFLRLYEATTT